MSNITRAADQHLVMAAIHPKPKPVKTKKKIKRESPDMWFSLCVRERANWTCQACGKHYEPQYTGAGLPKNQGLHCSHYIGRANYSVRFDPLDADAHCYGCHSKFEQNPHVFKEWKLSQLGMDFYEILIEKSTDIMIGKQARQEKQQIAEHYKDEFYRMMSIRSLGITGKLEFQGYF
jgi:uncharacterized CHY-type Zn-finger protein